MSFLFGPFLSAQRDHAVLEEDLDVALLDTREFRNYPILLVGLLAIHGRPHAARSGAWYLKCAKCVVEKPVHLVMQIDHRSR